MALPFKSSQTVLGAPELSHTRWESWGSHPKGPNPAQGCVGSLICERTRPFLPSPRMGASSCALDAFSNWMFFPSVPGDLSWWEVKPHLFGKGRRGPSWMNGSEESGGSETRGDFPASSSCPWRVANTHLCQVNSLQVPGDPEDDSWFYSTNAQPWKLQGCQTSRAILGSHHLDSDTISLQEPPWRSRACGCAQLEFFMLRVGVSTLQSHKPGSAGCLI